MRINALPEYRVQIRTKTGTRTTSACLLADCVQKTPNTFFFFPSKSSYLTVVLGSSSLPSAEMKLNELVPYIVEKRNIGSGIQWIIGSQIDKAVQMQFRCFRAQLYIFFACGAPTYL